MNPERIDRIIGQYPQGITNDGPVLLVTAGVHGNEPSGILALRRFFDQLETRNIPVGGISGVPSKADNIRILLPWIFMRQRYGWGWYVQEQYPQRTFLDMMSFCIN